MKDLTDTEFDFRVELILKNDKNGLREIYQCYGKVIYNIMLDIVKSPQDAEDLTSDFFLKLWDTAGQYRKGTGHKRYLTVMAKNLALDFIKKGGTKRRALMMKKQGTKNSRTVCG